MFDDPLTLYKLIVLYMLDCSSTPLTTAQISDFILEKDYTTFLTLQQVFSELTETELITAKSIGNRTRLTLTKEGQETLRFFENRITDAVKKEVRDFLNQNEITIRNEVSVTADYYKSTSGEYEARLTAKERDAVQVDLTLSFPTEEMAAEVCDHWQERSQKVYSTLMKLLL